VLIGDVNFPVRDEDRSIVADGSIAPGEMLFPNSSNDAEKNAPLEVVALEGFCKIMRTELLVHQLIPSPAMREALRPARADRRPLCGSHSPSQLYSAVWLYHGGRLGTLGLGVSGTRILLPSQVHQACVDGQCSRPGTVTRHCQDKLLFNVKIPPAVDASETLISESGTSI
jgi:hypothetical protein